MQLRPRCITCRQTGHTTCTPVVIVPRPVVKRRRRVQAQVQTQAPPRAHRGCSFCGTAGHYKPKCEKYKIFVDEVSRYSTTGVDAIIGELQKLFCGFVASQIHPSLLFNSSNEIFKIYVEIFMDTFNQHMSQPSIPVRAQAQAPPPPPPPHNSKIRLELCKNTSRAKKECGICLNDNISSTKIVKLGCGHEFCGDCTEKFVNTKPCCAFCRAEVKQVSVATKTMMAKLKKNKKFYI